MPNNSETMQIDVDVVYLNRPNKKEMMLQKISRTTIQRKIHGDAEYTVVLKKNVLRRYCGSESFNIGIRRSSSTVRRTEHP